MKVELAKFKSLQSKLAVEKKRACVRIATLLKDVAVTNAPKSPTAAELKAARDAKWKAKGKKPTARQKAAWKKARKPDAHTRPAPGGLERSIESEVYTEGHVMGVRVFVAANADAGDYAEKMHDEKGKTWKKRGIGTVNKGSQADEKFAKRAVEDNDEKIKTQLKLALQKAFGTSHV